MASAEDCKVFSHDEEDNNSDLASSRPNSRSAQNDEFFQEVLNPQQVGYTRSNALMKALSGRNFSGASEEKQGLLNRHQGHTSSDQHDSDYDLLHYQKIVERSAQFSRKFIPELFRKRKELKAEETSLQQLEVLSGFQPLVWITNTIGLLFIILNLTWVLKYNTFDLKSDHHAASNWHFMFMSIAMVLMGNALLMFRIFRNMLKHKLKIIHASTHSSALISALLALTAIIYHKNLTDGVHLYSAHSWIGTLTLIFILVQGFLGLFTFLYPGFQNSTRSLMLPYHVSLGNLIFIMAIVTSFSGISEYARMTAQTSYKERELPSLILNLSSILIVIFGILVIYITSNINYKRYPRIVDTSNTSY